jgi:hypothetical protein
MKTQKAVLSLFASAIMLLATSVVRAESVTAVSSRVNSDYVRARQADGSFQPEYFAFGRGGKWGGEISDSSMDKLRFGDVLRVIAAPLADQNYLPATDPNKTKLIIMVYWGTTSVPMPASESVAYQNMETFQSEATTLLREGFVTEANALIASGVAQLNVESDQRDSIDFKNASMLGYDSDALVGTDFGNNRRGTALGERQNDLVKEIEDNRYFVVLMAYDFQLMWKEKKHKLLWETRFSINERHNEFDKALPVMAKYASRYFGEDSHGLLRTQVPEGQVEIGETKSLGEVAEPQK